MILTAIALLGAAPIACPGIPGAERLWDPATRWVVVGEQHGTNEAPEAFADLVCLASKTGRPVTVALEYMRNSQPAIDAYMASDGGPQAKAALLTLPQFADPIQDGRGSIAFFRLLERLRVMRKAGMIGSVMAADIDATQPMTKARDAILAEHWQAAAAPANGIVLAYAGNVHAMRKPVTFGDRTVVTAASLLPRARTLTVDIMTNGGESWNCVDEACGVHPDGPARPGASRGIRYSSDPAMMWDATFDLAVPATAARPAREFAANRPSGR